jgi:propionate CoA-transferase
VTERAVFELTDKGVMLTELAPGLDLERDVLAHMEFRPLISPNLKDIDVRAYRSEPMDLALAAKEER